jgi:hypothetical protein
VNRIDWDRLDGAAHIRGFNYQPTWGRNGYEVWLAFDPERYRAELVRGKELFPAMNTVRIWLSWSAWKLDAAGVADAVGRAIEIIGDLDLLVIPVLYTRWRGRPEFDPVEFAQIHAADLDEDFGPHVDAIVGPQVGNPAILAWDLCNEAIQEKHQLKPGETTWAFDYVVDRQFEWLEYHRSRIKSLDAGAATCVGYMCRFENPAMQERFEALGDLLTPHLYPRLMWGIEGRSGTFEDYARQFVGGFMDDLRSRGVARPVVSSECCWGSLDDAERAEWVRIVSSAFGEFGLGALAHALWCSPVADLHPPELGPVVGPGYMGFINADGSLRDGHDIFNRC